jgi:hypothetical protein
MRLIRIITILIFILLTSSVVVSSREEAIINAASLLQEIKTVSLCELAHNPILYDKKIVRIQAILVENHAPRVDGGDPLLLDLSCYSDDTVVLAEIDPSYQPDAEIQKAFEYSERKKDEYGNSRADVIVVGQYDGPNGIGYGHLNWARSQFVITRYEEVKPINSRSGLINSI